MNIYSNLLLKNLIHIVIQYYKIYAFRKKNLHLIGVALSPLAKGGGGGKIAAILFAKGWVWEREETCIKLTFTGDDTVWNMLGQLKLLLLPELADLVDTELEIVLSDGAEIDLVDQLAVLFKVIGQKVRHCELSVWVKGFIHSDKDGFPVPFL